MRGAAARQADDLAARLARRGRVAHQPEINVERLCHALEVPVRRAPLRGDGQLVVEAGGPAITVHEQLTGARYRFTVAHELGHLVLAYPVVGEVRLASRGWTEAFCNQFAASLLIPRHWLLAARPRPSLSGVRDIASKTGTSLSAAAVRARDLLGWHCVLLHWSLHRGEWMLDGQAGLAGTKTGYVADTEHTGWQLHALRDDPSASRALTLRWDDREVTLEADADVGYSDAVALAWLPEGTPARPRRCAPRPA